MTTQPKKWTEETIKEKLETSDKFLERAVIALFRRQTEDEKTASDAKHTNSRGFNKPDANKMTIYAKVCLAGKNQYKGEGNRLEEWQRADCRARIMKYWKQIIEIANEQQKG